MTIPSGKPQATPIDDPKAVAIIGAGPAGLVTARWLRASGLVPVLYEQGDGVGGQWRVGAPHSSIWPGMHTNTSRVTTAFGDMPHPDGTPLFPRAEDIGQYLERYAAHFGLLEQARLGVRVQEVEREGEGWRIRSVGTDGTERTEHYARVVLAPGRHHARRFPTIAGMDRFTGAGGVRHAATYRGAHEFRGQRVLVAGHSISSVEIAGDLALQGAAHVVVAARRHRFVLQRLLAGVPMDHRVYSRAAGMMWESMPPAFTAAWLRELTLRTSGHPAQFGAPVYSEDVLQAGFTHSPFYLTLVAEGRIATRPWISRVDGGEVVFTDGTRETIDTILLCTGYDLDLPFLGPQLRAALEPDAVHLNLHEHTWHPDLPGLAVVGQYEHSGPFFPTLEAQGRWVAYVMSGRIAAPAAQEIGDGLAAARERRGAPYIVRMHVISRRFARLAGVEPALERWPALRRALLFGPLSPASFRLEGLDALPEAAARVLADAGVADAVTSAQCTEEEVALLAALPGGG